MRCVASCFAFLLLAALVTSGCGSGRQLQSVTISPASADARNYADGQVPFAATGTFSKPPSPAPLTSQNVLWCIGSVEGAYAACNPSMPLFPTVDQNGVAQCGTFVGTATVLTGTPLPGIADAARLKIFGTATLICP